MWKQTGRLPMTCTTSWKRGVFQGESVSSVSFQYTLLFSGATGGMVPCRKCSFLSLWGWTEIWPLFSKLSQLLPPIIVLPFSEFLQHEWLLSAEHLVRVNPWATEPGIVGKFEMEGHRIPESHRNNIVIIGEAYKQRDTMGYTGVNMYEKEV